MSRVDVLLSRLDRVRDNGGGRYMARCPAHDDGKASLSIREKDDGSILLHCFAQCDTDKVLGALGLEFRDLFPERVTDHSPPARNRIPAADLLKLIAHELMVVAVLSNDMLERRSCSQEDWKRFAEAANALLRARAHLD